MDQSNYSSMMQNYIEEAMKVKESFETAENGLLEEFEVRKMVFEDVKVRFLKTEEAFKRGETTQEVYDQVKRDLNRVEETMNELNQKLDEINTIMAKRLEAAHAKLNDLKKQYVDEIDQEKKKLKYQLMKAKYDYLQDTIKAKNKFIKELKHAKKDFNKTTKEIRKASKEMSAEANYLQEIDQYLGLDSIIELQDDFQVVISEEIDDEETALTKEELHDALQLGKISAKLEKKINKAIRLGLI
ncbi:hypothetical protein PH210_12655 [Paenibacillus sp. BSR1-1]|uniref:hypothetical protein n=1 Tax=Paenibacillus sp. BSR1-1 TaxID=3020845 RepID=UPI0025B2335E|nr:hypothetical protein [Paenibacillus sp. BSR1-1]MDN3017042.1 hypothetical protein [Paenibacillus sp. BSR1-1]